MKLTTDLSAYLPDLAGKVHISADLFETIKAALVAAEPFRDAFHYNPGHSDLDNEQPITIHVTLGDWRRLNYALRVMEPSANRTDSP